jgi:hypothetical protein
MSVDGAHATPGPPPAATAGGAPASTGGASTPPALRAQLLATEHWSLLATRSMTWSEIMSRITIQLTVLSASLVVLALVAQASGFGGPFRVLSIGLASAILLLGTLTAVRVVQGSMEDHALVIGMNRLRAAYLTLDPSLEEYLVTSAHDDMAGVLRTYTLGTGRRTFAHVVGSTSMFVTVVNTLVAGTLGALIASAAGAATALVVLLGVLSAAVYFAVMLQVSRRSFEQPRLAARFPTSTAA